MAVSILYDVKLNFDPHHAVISLFMEIGPDIVVQGPDDEKPIKPKAWSIKAIGRTIDDVIANIRTSVLDTSKVVFPAGMVHKNKSPFNLESLIKKLPKMPVETSAFSSFFDLTPYGTIKDESGEMVVSKIFSDNDVEVVKILLAPYNDSKILYSDEEFQGHAGIKSQVAIKLTELSNSNPEAAEMADIFVANIGHRIIKNT